LNPVASFATRDGNGLVAWELRNDTGLSFTGLENGSIFSITLGDILINQVLGEPMGGGIGNLYIRQPGSEKVAYVPVMGAGSSSRLGHDDRRVVWQGDLSGLEYRCILQLAVGKPIWYWTMQIRNATGAPTDVDVVLAQDLGLAQPAAVRSNELYVSQYIDHTPLHTEEFGYVVCSRQNQKQGEQFPRVVHGCLSGADGYLTDGFQFYGLEYKETDIPAALMEHEFPNSRYQYEVALPSLKSYPTQVLPGAEAEITFFGLYQDHPAATSVRDLAVLEEVKEEFQRLRQGRTDSSPRAQSTSSSLFQRSHLWDSEDLPPEDLDRFFSPERRHLERRNRTILSFFHGEDRHVVTKQKELFCERPHGHILRSGSGLLPDENILSVTSWMYGVFASHLAIGNTNFNNVLTISRNPLNVLKSSGVRIFVKIDDGYQLLALPSAFEMWPGGGRWIYKHGDLTIHVKLWTSARDPVCFLEIDVEGSEELEFLISNNVLVGEAEFDHGCRIEIDQEAKRAELAPASKSLLGQRYPDARFFIAAADPTSIETVGGDGLLFDDGVERQTPHVVFKTRPIRTTRLILSGNILSRERAGDLVDEYARPDLEYEEMQNESQTLWRSIRKGASLHLTGESDEVSKLNDILRWYTHNAIVHISTPYGLEQYSGAAWGLRDVCQGPIEFLLATRNFEAMRSVLKKVHEHQLRESGDWPQWFMLDRYGDMHAPNSHADIVIWPIKALCDYLEATDDLLYLDEEVGFTEDGGGASSGAEETIYSHTLRQIERMEGRCLPGTSLAAYGHGDWEDSLQPADPSVRERWVSPWTVELMYQTLLRYARVCERAGRLETSRRLTAFCRRIKDDFNRYLVGEGVVAGLAELDPPDVDYLLHPSDTRTGVHYRLLPMTRGIISGIFTPEQMQDHLLIIKRYLKFPDGVRLMDQPLRYRGGIETLFKRAETAANFGREIGLEYVHAHIRYAEAMAKIGDADEAFRALLTVMPIGIEDVVPSAMCRQSNAYFSSSDAAFSDRYEASDDFGRVKEGSIGFKGGWRIYSSGPGMYIAELILNLLGLRDYFSDVLLDPVLPKSLTGLTFDFEYEGRAVRYTYEVTRQSHTPYRIVINGSEVKEMRPSENPYRSGGVLVEKEDFLRRLDSKRNHVEIFT
jgi:cellobiose phosphorylase